MEQVELPYEVAEHRKIQREAVVFKVLRHAMDALSERGLRYLSLVATIGLFVWSSWQPDSTRTVNACLMGVLFLFTLFKRESTNVSE